MKIFIPNLLKNVAFQIKLLFSFVYKCLALGLGQWVFVICNKILSRRSVDMRVRGANLTSFSYSVLNRGRICGRVQFTRGTWVRVLGLAPASVYLWRPWGCAAIGFFSLFLTCCFSCGGLRVSLWIRREWPVVMLNAEEEDDLQWALSLLKCQSGDSLPLLLICEWPLWGKDWQALPSPVSSHRWLHGSPPCLF